MRTTPTSTGDDSDTRLHLIRHAQASAEAGVLNLETSWRLERTLRSIAIKQLYLEFFRAYAKDFIDIVFHPALANQPERRKTELIDVIITVSRSVDKMTEKLAMRWIQVLVLTDQVPSQIIQNGCQLLREIDVDNQAEFIEEALFLIVENFGADSGQVATAKAFFTKLVESYNEETAQSLLFPSLNKPVKTESEGTLLIALNGQ